MAISNAEMKAIFDGVFGNNGVDWKNSLTAIHNAAQATNTALATLQTATANRAAKIIEVPPFYGRDDEDPYEWIQAFLQAHTTNGWANDRKVALAAGHLKEAAYDWYQTLVERCQIGDQSGDRIPPDWSLFFLKFSSIGKPDCCQKMAQKEDTRVPIGIFNRVQSGINSYQ
jgi:hypothetical protein